MTDQRLPNTRSLCVFCALVSFSASGAAQAQCQYEVQTWGPWMCTPNLPNSYTSLGLNNLGGWVGNRFKCWPSEGYLPVYCPAGGTPQVLPMPPGAGPKGAWAYGVNDLGVAAGVSYEGPNGVPEKGAVWWPDGSVTIIPPASGSVSPAYGINNSNMVVGNSGGLPYVWHDGLMTSIPSPGLGGGSARRVSDSGFVTGTFGSDSTNARAYRWRDAELALLSPVNGHVVSKGYGVNDLGWVVGTSMTYVGGSTGFLQTPTLWTRADAIALPLPLGYSKGYAVIVNDSGVIGGQAFSAGPGLPTIQVLWIDGQVYPVNSLTVPGSPNIGSVVAINSVGQILSGGSAKLLTPIGASPADLNGDCSVNGADLALILSEWGPVLQPGSACDINGDGTVNGADLGLLLGAWSP